jgi:drug/metabolite transporter (DMT)-like permease
MNFFSPPILLLFSAFLHAMWNATTKVSRDKNIFVLLTILFASALILFTLIVSERSFQIGGVRGLKYALLAGVFEGTYLIAMARAFQRTSLAKAYSVLRGGAMVLVWVGSLGLGLERFNWLSAVGSFIVLAGIYLTGIDSGRPPGAAGNELIWPVLGAFFGAGYHLCYGVSLKGGADPKALFVTSLVTSLPFVFASARVGFLDRVSSLVKKEAYFLCVSSLSASVGFLLFLYGLKASGPGYAITLRNSSIFFSLGFSLLIKDRVTRYQVMGAIIVGLGAIFLSAGGLR